MKNIALVTLLALLSITAQADISSQKRESIRQMLSIMGIDEKLDSVFEKSVPMIDGLAKKLDLNNSGKKELRQIFKSWLTEDIDRVGMKKKVVDIYAESFSNSEINQITAFYKSPLGKKLLTKNPQLMKKAGEMGAAEVKSKQGALMVRLLPFLKKYKEQSTN